MHRLVIAAVLAALVGAPAGAASGPRIVTERDSGKTIVLQRGASASLRLSEGWNWGEPRVSSHAIELSPVFYFRDPGFTEWTVDAVTRGKAVVIVTRASGARVRIVFRVTRATA